MKHGFWLNFGILNKIPLSYSCSLILFWSFWHRSNSMTETAPHWGPQFWKLSEKVSHARSSMCLCLPSKSEPSYMSRPLGPDSIVNSGLTLLGVHPIWTLAQCSLNVHHSNHLNFLTVQYLSILQSLLSMAVAIIHCPLSVWYEPMKILLYLVSLLKWNITSGGRTTLARRYISWDQIRPLICAPAAWDQIRPPLTLTF